MPELIGTHRQREEMEFSMSKALQQLIADLKPVFINKGFSRQYQRIVNAQQEYQRVISQLGQEEPEVPQPKQAASVEDPNKQAHAIINDVISRLPQEHKGPARDFVTRRGFTLQALQQYLTTHKL